MGLSGRAKHYFFSCPLSCNWNSAVSIQISDCARVSLTPLEKDILSKLHASVFMNMEPSLSLPLIGQNVNHRVWTDGKTVGQAQTAIPVIVKPKDPHLFPHQKQYSLKPKIKKGFKPTIENLKEPGQLIPCNSPCHTFILCIKMLNDKWRLVQDSQ